MKEVELASIIAEKTGRMEEERFKQFKKDLKNYIEKNYKAKYFALMGMPSKDGNSTRYVTILNINKDNFNYKCTEEIFNFILENEDSLGKIKGYIVNEENNYLEIWYRNECYLFFVYDNGVIEIGY